MKMKRYKLLLIGLLIVGCAFAQSAFDKYIKTPINIETLVERDDIYYTKDINKPYTGAVFRLYQNGDKWIEGYLKDGKKEGKWTDYYEDGHIKAEAYFKDGILEGKGTDYYEDGHIKAEAYFKDGMPDGKGTDYYEDGQIKAEAYFKDGILEGKGTEYYEDGQIKAEAYFKDGMPDGKGFIAGSENYKQEEKKQLTLKRDDIYDNSWAVIIGIDKYENLSNLDYAVEDAKSVKTMLVDKFDYQEENVKFLVNDDANKTNIVNVISDVSLKAGENDRILVFFAGHGETMPLPEGGEMGYLVPIDGNQENLFASAIPMDDLKRLSNMSKAKHMLFLVDACYGGLAAVGSRGLEPTKTPNYIEKITNIKSRQIITAGGKDEEVFEKSEWGHSAYTKNLLSALEDGLADSNSDGYITADELGDYLSEKVSIDSENQQTPQSRRLTSHEGEFVFFGSRKDIGQDETILDNEEINPSIPPLYWDNHPLGFNISALTGGMNVKSIGKMVLLSSYLGASYTLNDFVFDFGYEHSKNITSNIAFTSNAIFIEYVDVISIVHSIIPSGNYLYSSVGFNIENITYIDEIANYKREAIGVIPKVGLVWGWHWFEKGGMRWDGVINANLGYAINDLTNAAGEKYYNGLIIELGLAMTY
jgi:antitoxin component YwqK of YwqJK toxin-antitoxin module